MNILTENIFIIVFVSFEKTENLSEIKDSSKLQQTGDGRQFGQKHSKL